MLLRLATLQVEQAMQIREWRNLDLAPYRTPFMLTEEMQADWYDKIATDRRANCRYFALLDEDDTFVGYVGLTDIEWENGIAQIALLISPEHTRNGYGTEAVRLILDTAFRRMRLVMVYGECYECNPALGFWQKMVEKYEAYSTRMPSRKFWDGMHWHSLYFAFEGWVEDMLSIREGWR